LARRAGGVQGLNIDFDVIFTYLESIPPLAVRLQAPQGRHQLKAYPRGKLYLDSFSMTVAFMIDGAYFLRRFKHLFPNLDEKSAPEVCLGLHRLIATHLLLRLKSQPSWRDILVGLDFAHIKELNIIETQELYRIFFYDSPPLKKRMHYPVSKKAINFAKTEEAIFREALHGQLKATRKVALRLGRLSDNHGWRLEKTVLEALLRGQRDWQSVTDADFRLDTKQKGVDTRLGLDMAALAYRRLIDQIVIVGNDADFVPATKMARREGIDVVLNAMGGHVAIDLQEHVDGLVTMTTDLISTKDAA
jgi:uncharacterized LabA/DUF88 family protein